MGVSGMQTECDAVKLVHMNSSVNYSYVPCALGNIVLYVTFTLLYFRSMLDLFSLNDAVTCRGYTLKFPVWSTGKL